MLDAGFEGIMIGVWLLRCLQRLVMSAFGEMRALQRSRCDANMQSARKPRCSGSRSADQTGETMATRSPSRLVNNQKPRARGPGIDGRRLGPRPSSKTARRAVTRVLLESIKKVKVKGIIQAASFPTKFDVALAPKSNDELVEPADQLHQTPTSKS